MKKSKLKFCIRKAVNDTYFTKGFTSLAADLVKRINSYIDYSYTQKHKKR